MAEETGERSSSAAKERPPEREIYRQMWDKPAYRVVAPGESVAQVFLAQARPKVGASVIDFGCGTGRGGLMLAIMGGMDVTMMDFADNCLDEDIRPILEKQAHSIRFIEADLTKPSPVAAEYGYCTDVMEHIPPADVDAVLNNVLQSARHCFFQISTVDDVCGKEIGHALHLSVHPYEWWLAKFRDRDCVIHWSQEVSGACLFYVTAWIDGQTLSEAGILNVKDETVHDNVVANIIRGFKQVEPHETNDFECMILGGGPSLNDHIEEIRGLREDGVKLITLNGSHDWCLDHGIGPISAQVVVDAREFNSRFTRRPQPQTKYFIASQCHPSVFDGLPPDQVMIWHTNAELIREELDAQYKTWWPVPGGSTVLLRTIPMFRMLGFKKFHLFGCDSCLSESELHHAYSQPENDSPIIVPVAVTGGRIFQCHPWMAAQAQEFMGLIKFMGDELELQIHGDGLLAHLLRVGADMAALEPAGNVVTSE